MITIELYEQVHQQQVIELVLTIQQKEFNVPITLNDQQDLLNVNDFYRKGNGNFWVALNEGNVIGSIALLDSGKGLGTLRKMFVHKDYRGKEFGIAQMLFNTLVTYAGEKGFNKIMLGTIDRLVAAQKFYLKNGFVIIKKNDLPVNFPLMQVDNVFFSKTI